MVDVVQGAEMLEKEEKLGNKALVDWSCCFGFELGKDVIAEEKTARFERLE
jgi:hypothetical protein